MAHIEVMRARSGDHRFVPKSWPLPDRFTSQPADPVLRRAQAVTPRTALS